MKRYQKMIKNQNYDKYEHLEGLVGRQYRMKIFHQELEKVVEYVTKNLKRKELYSSFQ